MIIYFKVEKMDLVTIDQIEHLILNQPSIPIEFPLSDHIKNVIQEMSEFFKTLPTPAGLAAPQVGYPYQIIFFQVTETAMQYRRDADGAVPLTILLNASYSPILSEGKTIDWEGCFSVPDKMGEVYRYKAIHYEGYTPEGKLVEGIARGYLARILQHEIEHTRGKLYLDFLEKNARFGLSEEWWPVRIKELDEFRRKS